MKVTAVEARQEQIDPNNTTPLSEVVTNPYKKRSRRLLEWLLTIHSSYTLTSETVNLVSILTHKKRIYIDFYPGGFLKRLKDLFLRAYGFDGYNPVDKTATTTNGERKPIQRVGWGLLLLSFIGFPNRPNAIDDFGAPILTPKQLFKNFFGGWTLSTKNWSPLEIFELFFKIGLVFPVKLIGVPLKIIINTIKLFTELALPIIEAIIFTIRKNFIRATEDSNNRLISVPGTFLKIILLLVHRLFEYAAIWPIRVGLLLTSPAKSASLAFAAGRSLKISWFGPEAEEWISRVVGALGWFVSFALTALLWTLILPIAISAITTIFPAIIPAIAWVTHLPAVTASIAWISQFSVVTATLNLASGLFASVGAALGLAFGPAITAIAGLFGLQISTLAIVVGTTIGMLGAPVIIFGNMIADHFSELWIIWHNTPIKTPHSAPQMPIIEEDRIYLPKSDLHKIVNNPSEDNPPTASEIHNLGTTWGKKCNEAFDRAIEAGEKADRAYEVYLKSQSNPTGYQKLAGDTGPIELDDQQAKLAH